MTRYCPVCLSEVLETAAGAQDAPATCPQCGNPLASKEDLTQIHDLNASNSGTTFHPDGMPPMPAGGAGTDPKSIGGFKVIRKLGAGGFGAVYLARDPDLDRFVALKVPQDRQTFEPDFLERFKREARSAARLQHPGIVEIYSVEQDTDRPFLVCEYIPGTTLNAHVGQNPLSFRRAAEIVRDVARALDFAHSRGIVHRDVKPGNILLDTNGRPRLADFGMSKRMDADITMTIEGQILGTPAYMSPEQAAGEPDQVGPLSDVYSLGVVLYTLLTGELPFRGKARMVIDQVVHDLPRNPRSLNDAVPIDLETISQKAMEKEPRLRYQSAGEFADDLDRWLKNQPIRARHIGPAGKFTRWCRRNPAVASLTITVAVLLVLMTVGAMVALTIQTAERRKVEAALREARNLLAMQYIDKGIRSFDLLDGATEQDVVSALPWMVEALAVRAGDSPNESIERIRVGALLRECPKLDYLKSLPFNVIRSLAQSRDGKYVLVTGTEGIAQVWSIVTGTSASAPLCNKTLISAGDLSPDGRHAVLGTPNGTIQVWDLETGIQVSEPWGIVPSGPKSDETILCLRYSSDGRRIAAGDNDGGFAVWDAASRAIVGQPPRYKWPVVAVDFSPDSRLVVAATLDGLNVGHEGIAAVFETEPWKLVVEYRGHRGGIVSARFNPDGTQVVTNGQVDGTAQIWASGTGVATHPPLVHGASLKFGVWSPDGKRLATADGKTGTLRLWATDSGKQVGEPAVLNEGIEDVAFSNQGEFLVTACHDRYVQVFRGDNLRRHGLPIHHPGKVRWARFTPDTRGIVTLCEDGFMRRWNLPLEQGPSTGQDGAVDLVAVSADAARVATGDRLGTIVVSRIGEYPEITRLSIQQRHRGRVRALAISRDGSLIATGGADGTVLLCDSQTGAVVARPLNQSASPVNSVEFSPDVQQLLTVASDGMISVFQIPSGQPQFSPLLSGKQVTASLSPDGMVIAAMASTDLVFWDAKTGQRRNSPRNLRSSIAAGVFLSDPDQFLTGTKDGYVQLWSVFAARQIAGLRHGGTVEALASGAGGTYFASGGTDKSVRVWRTRDLREATPPLRHGAPIASIEFSPDERFVAAVSSDGIVRVWETTHGRLMAPPQFNRENPVTPTILTKSKPFVRVFFTAASDGLWNIQGSGRLNYLSLMPVKDALTSLREASAAMTGFEIDSTNGGYVPLSKAALEKVSY